MLACYATVSNFASSGTVAVNPSPPRRASVAGERHEFPGHPNSRDTAQCRRHDATLCSDSWGLALSTRALRLVPIKSALRTRIQYDGQAGGRYLVGYCHRSSLQRTRAELRCHSEIEQRHSGAPPRASRFRRPTPVRRNWRVFLYAQRLKRRLCLVGDCVAWRSLLRSICRTQERDTSRGTNMDRTCSRIFRSHNYRDLLGVAPRQSYDRRLEPRSKQDDHGPAAGLVSLRHRPAYSGCAVRIPATEWIAPPMGRNPAAG